MGITFTDIGSISGTDAGTDNLLFVDVDIPAGSCVVIGVCDGDVNQSPIGSYFFDSQGNTYTLGDTQTLNNNAANGCGAWAYSFITTPLLQSNEDTIGYNSQDGTPYVFSLSVFFISGAASLDGSVSAKTFTNLSSQL